MFGFTCFSLGILLFFASQNASAEQEPKALVEYYFQAGCRECELIKNFVLPKIEERFSGHYEMKRFDIGVKENFLRLAEYQDSLSIKGNEPVTMIVGGKIALSGYKAIEAGLESAIDENLAELASAPRQDIAPQKQAPPTQNPSNNILKKRAEKMTLVAVVCAGLLDGINPCAFSTLVFFMSLLAVARVGAGRLLAVGAAYCMASFLTYTGLGFGLFRFIKTLSAYTSLQMMINWGMAAILIVLAALSFRDAWRYHHGGRPEDVSLQLPDKVKNLIHKLMRSGLKLHWLIPGAFTIGVAVTVLESVCTGQVYLPTLTLLAKETAESFRWGALILLYNVMFTLPLIFVFILTYFGVRTPRLLDWSKRNVVPSKILLALLFLVLAAMIFVL